jgi:hypothetical protein
VPLFYSLIGGLVVGQIPNVFVMDQQVIVHPINHPRLVLCQMKNGLKKEIHFSTFCSVNIIHIGFYKNEIFFIGLSSLSAVLLFIRTLAYFISCHITARSLHNQMFNALLRAPVFFFDSNPIGKKLF